jgi:hypothetical protein
MRRIIENLVDIELADHDRVDVHPIRNHGPVSFDHPGPPFAAGSAYGFHEHGTRLRRSHPAGFRGIKRDGCHFASSIESSLPAPMPAIRPGTASESGASKTSSSPAAARSDGTSSGSAPQNRASCGRYDSLCRWPPPRPEPAPPRPPRPSRLPRLPRLPMPIGGIAMLPSTSVPPAPNAWLAPTTPGPNGPPSPINTVLLSAGAWVPVTGAAGGGPPVGGPAVAEFVSPDARAGWRLITLEVTAGGLATIVGTTDCWSTRSSELTASTREQRWRRRRWPAPGRSGTGSRPGTRCRR